jgi:hypothetical protein
MVIVYISFRVIGIEWLLYICPLGLGNEWLLSMRPLELWGLNGYYIYILWSFRGQDLLECFAKNLYVLQHIGKNLCRILYVDCCQVSMWWIISLF